jgi:hypothetical protein
MILVKIDVDLQRQVIVNRLELGSRVADSVNWYHCKGWLAA